MRWGRCVSLALLAACVAAALATRRFVCVAWYPVAVSFAFAAAFGLSLFTPRPLALEFAERIPPRVLPLGAEAYCRKVTAFWCALLALNGIVAAATVFAPRWAWVVWNCAASYLVMGAAFLAEALVRRRRFAVEFRTSGSTGEPKRIVKPFPALAKEVAMHRARLSRVLAANPAFISTVEPRHMYGTLWRELLPRAAGCAADPEIVLAPETLLAKMRAADCAFIVTTPSFLSRFAAYADQYDVPRNAVEIVTSGALLDAETSAAARRVFGVAPLEIFGSTETGGVAWRRQSEGELWTPFDEVSVRALDDGRLAVRSPFSFTRGEYAMGDAVKFAPDGRRFALLGRVDRLVKIAEQRVSLPEMESKMRSLVGVRDAALVVLDGAKGPALGAVVAVDSIPADKPKAALALRSRLVPIFPKGAAPKKFRFVSELPRNAQGKVLAAELRRLFAPPLELPRIENAVRDELGWSADLTFSASTPYFDGHFPGFPILPGVVQLGLAVRFAEDFAGRAMRLAEVRKMKFMRIVRPGETVRFALGRKGANEFSYSYSCGGETCSCGTLVFAEGAA